MIWEKIKTNPTLKWSLISMAVFVFLAVVIFSVNIYINNRYRDKILPNIFLGSLSLGGLTYDQARQEISGRVDFINQRGFFYNSELKNVVVYPNVLSATTPDTYQPLVIWDIDQSLNQIFDWQEKKSLLNLPTKLQALWFSKTFYPSYQWDKEQHLAILKTDLSGLLTEKQEAGFTWENNEFKIIPENAGQTFAYEQAMAQTAEQLNHLNSQDITLQVVSEEPTIVSSDVEKLKLQIIATSNRGHFYLTWDKKDWGVPSDIWRQWLEIKADRKPFYLGFNQETVVKYLQEEKILDDINQPVQNAKFAIVDGKVSEFVAAQPGQEINLAETISNMEQVIADSGELETKLVVKVVEPKVANEDVNDLGITEIIGTGESDFTGSPKNRIHNITVGAKTLDGILVAPDEEFSLLKALGEIDGEHGYLQELVIKDNQTKPEFGGGLCQIGTTTFRATIASGLPVSERRNHSYRVVYYEPAGTDATIYSPAPDYKFKNDTGHYVLIKTRIEGTKIYFDFWGTKDGREINIEPPVIYNIVAPPPEKIIKTIDLEVGVKKCTESAHAGADAKFDYSVKYPDQSEPIITTFRSHYVPWQKVCLLGVTAEELAAELASSTPEQIIEE